MAQMLLMPTNYLFQTPKSEFCVLSTTYFFIYLWQHNLVFKKFLEVTWNNLNNKTPPYHHDTVTLQVPKPKFTNTKRLSTQLPPLLYYHRVHYHCHTATVPSILLLPSFIPPSQYQLTTITNQHCFNKTRQRPVPLTMDTENCYPPPQKTIKFFKKKRQKKSITQNLPIYRPMHIPLALQTKSCKTSRATKYSIRGVTFSSLLNPQFIFIIKFRIIELWFYRVVYFIIIRNCNTH